MVRGIGAGRTKSAALGIHAIHGQDDGKTARKADHNGRSDGEREHPPVDGDLIEPWRFGRRERDECRKGPGREREAGGASRETDEKTLGERLADEMRAAGPEREACGELEPTSGGVREQKIRDVGAADEEHARGGAEQKPQLRPHRGRLRLEQRGQSRIPRSLLALGYLTASCGRDDVELRLCVRDRAARREPANGAEHPGAPLLGIGRLGQPAVRVPAFRDLREREVLPHHADDLDVPAVQTQGAADDIRAARRTGAATGRDRE